MILCILITLLLILLILLRFFYIKGIVDDWNESLDMYIYYRLKFFNDDKLRYEYMLSKRLRIKDLVFKFKYWKLDSFVNDPFLTYSVKDVYKKL